MQTNGGLIGQTYRVSERMSGNRGKAIRSDEVRFYSLLADGANYPRPNLSMLPEYMVIHKGTRSDASITSAFYHCRQLFHQARYALSKALELAGVDESSAVLMPAYHCRSLVEPALHLNAEVLFYSHTADLAPKISELRWLVKSSPTPVKAIVLPHYFGFPQAVEQIQQFCKSEELTLIEDCAHAFYGTAHGKALGTFGEFAIASPRKFFPISDGGCLVDNRCELSDEYKLVHQPFINELKFLIRISPLARKNAGVRGREAFSHVEPDELLGRDDNNDDVERETQLKYFCEDSRDVAGLRTSSLMVKLSPHTTIAARRRQNYRQWLEEIEGLRGCIPLFSELKEGIVPYAFPLILEERPTLVFCALKKAGIPMWRWEDIAVTNCQNSLKYRKGLIQLPCHQDLSRDDIEWMVKTIRYVLNIVLNK